VNLSNVRSGSSTGTREVRDEKIIARTDGPWLTALPFIIAEDKDEAGQGMGSDQAGSSELHGEVVTVGGFNETEGRAAHHPSSTRGLQ
jgi:hypothetical protein